MLHIVVAAALLVIDQLTKFLTVSKVELNTGIVDLPGFLHVTYVKNFGAAFGILENAGWLRILLAVLLAAFTAGMVLSFLRGWFKTGLTRWSGAVFLAGIFGNGIDRALFGHVVDMLEFDSGAFAIFNLADCLALFGGIVFCISLILGGFSLKNEEEDEEEEVSAAPPRRAEPVRRSAPAPQEQRPVRPAASTGTTTAQRPVRPVASTGTAAAQRPVRSAASTGTASAQRPARPAASTGTARPAASAAAEEKPVRTAAPAPVQKTAAPAVKSPAPAASKAAPAETTGSDEFDLDSILAEFK